mmetsp:Transcript_27847/g.57203  ORF Transcript_27847/g.57203 Transcript_27847/m.57203 type:complete len:355 (+) Transcript_27847:144-1208(+)
MVVVYNRPLMKRHLAPRFSSAYLLYVVAAATAVVLPFFLAYSASGPNFWSKQKTYFEQPEVKFEYKAMFLLEGTRDNGPMSLFYSTESKLNKALGGNTLRVPVVKSREVDLEGDGLMDQLKLSVLMPLVAGEAVHSVTLFVFLQVRLNRWSRLSVPVMAFVQQASPLPGKSLLLDADLAFRQTRPVASRGGYRVPYGATLLDAHAFLPWDGGNQSVQDFIPNLIDNYRSRNFTATLTNVHSLWSSAQATTGSVQGLAARALNNADSVENAQGVFNLSATLRVPSLTPITYTPGVSEVIFDAWIKYLAMAVAVVWLLDKCLLQFVFHHHLVPTHEHVEGQHPHNSPGAFGRFKTL